MERFLEEYLNLSIAPDELQKKFEEIDADCSGELDRKEFLPFLITLYNRNEIAGIFNQYAQPEDMAIGARSFRRFLLAQGENVSEAQAQKLILTLNRINGVSGSRSLGFREFQDFMFGEANRVLDPCQMEVCEDMSLPLTDYYIATSSNTYLCGHQLFGSSSVEMYSQALKRGCRCVELDCWDGRIEGDRYIPIIYNGHSLTTALDFREVVEASLLPASPPTHAPPPSPRTSPPGTQVIRRDAFAVSEFPLILSLEMHCSSPYQIAIADILTEVFVGLLPMEMPDPALPLPSPEALKGKVLIKGNVEVRLQTRAEVDAAQEDPSKLQALEAQRQRQEAAERQHAEQYQQRKLDSPDAAFESLQSSLANAPVPVSPDQRPVAGITGDLQVHRDLLALYYLFETSDATDGEIESKCASVRDGMKLPGREMSSLGESALERLARKDTPGLIGLCQQQLVRSSPSGLRTDSSNNSPLHDWAVGTQMVALNYQTPGQPMQALATHPHSRSAVNLRPDSMNPESDGTTGLGRALLEEWGLRIRAEADLYAVWGQRAPCDISSAELHTARILALRAGDLGDEPPEGER